MLDEAHLSPVAEDTFRSCMRLGADIHVISMTATPRLNGSDRFGVDTDDGSHPELSRRLTAKRIVELRDKSSVVEAAQGLLADGAKRVAVVCNTVGEARRVFTSIRHDNQHKYLIIGRQRPLDRDRLLEALVPRVRSGAPQTEPLVVVTTQCIEAGADFDFDGMVSEACPIDALRQRLGRLDRLGNLGESRCILIKPENFKEVPPYGSAPEATWRWLEKHAKKKQIDLGGQGWDAIRELVPDEARSSRPDPVSLLEPHLRMLARTSPRPYIEPDVDLLLHGHDRAPGAVLILWRRDVHPSGLEAANEILKILPPDALEACEVPLWEVQAWLARKPLAADSGDVEGAQFAEPKGERAAVFEPVLRWDGLEDGAVLMKPDQLKPGDLIVLPAIAGGYDSFGWNPISTAPVVDIAEEAYHQRTGRRIDRSDDPDADLVGDRIRRWSGGAVAITYPDEKRCRDVNVEVPLAVHSQSVATRAYEQAAALGLDPDLLREAGLHHDDGKADPNWQLCVNGGNLNRLAEPPLAKGDFVRSPLSRLPIGWRHEAESANRLPPETADLVRWLVATHHGHARPFWPIQHHGLGLAELMDRLQAKHGYWRLALYEAVLRCADRAVSKEEMDDA